MRDRRRGDDGNWAGDGKNLLVSGAYELPIADVLRVQVGAARTRQAIAAQARSPEGDAAHISRLTISLTAIKRSAAPLMPYGGVGIGFYRDRSIVRRRRAGVAAAIYTVASKCR